jgi:hypothetical protein
MPLTYDTQRHCLTDDRAALTLTQLEEIVIARLAGRDVISAAELCMAAWSDRRATNNLRVLLSQLRSKCARIGLEEPARAIGSSGVIRSNVIARAARPRCRCCGQPLPDPAPQYVRRASGGAR